MPTNSSYKTNKHKRVGNAGLTLLEIIISIFIFTLVAAAISLVFNRSLFVYQASTDKNKAAQATQAAMEWMARDISQASCIYKAEPSYVTLRNPRWGYIKYYLNPLDPTELMRNDCSTDYLLAKNVGNFSLNYYDWENQSVTSAGQAEEIELNLSVSSGEQEFKLYTLASPESCIEGCLWAKVYSSDDNAEDWTCFVQPTQGGYILGGRTGAGFDRLDQIDTTWHDAFVLKTDYTGNIGGTTGSWAKLYAVADQDVFYSAQEVADSYVLAGYTRKGSGHFDGLAVKTNFSGEVGPGYAGTWAWKYGRANDWDQDFIRSISVQQAGGYYILGGYTKVVSNQTGFDALLIKIDALGNQIWSKAYGNSTTGSDAYHDHFNCVQSTDDGYYILGGYTRSYGAGDYDFLLVKTNTEGRVIWAKTYGGLGEDILRYVQQTQDGGYILAGKFFPPLRNYRFLLIKTDANGNVGAGYPGTWAKYYGYSATHLYWAQQTQDGGYILAGESSSQDYQVPIVGGEREFLVIKTNGQGEVGPTYANTWAKVYGGPNHDGVYAIHQAPDGGYIIAGVEDIGANPCNENIFLIKTGPQGELDCCQNMNDVTDTDNLSKPINITPQNWTMPQQHLVTRTGTNMTNTIQFTEGDFTITPLCPNPE